MTAVLLSPHNDDSELFASYLCLRHRPHVIVCLRSRIQDQFGVSAEERERETDRAMKILHCSWEQWPIDEVMLDDKILREKMEEAATVYERCFAPAVELGGHPHHNLIGSIAEEFWPDCTFYLTYTRSGGRSRDGIRNEPDEPTWPDLKQQALDCYQSQLRVENCRPWFRELLDLDEWIQDR